MTPPLPSPTVLRVGSRTSPKALAGAVANALRQGDDVAVDAIGVGAVAVAVKALAIAHTFLGRDGLCPVSVPTFVDTDVDGEHRSAVRFLVEVRPAGPPITS